MRRSIYPIWCLAWLADVAVLARLGPSGRHPLAFGALYALGFILMLLLVKGFPGRIRRTRALALVFALALAGRCLFLDFPVNSDLYRYIWEGHIQNLGYNPYLAAPDSPLLADHRQGDVSAVWTGINHKSHPAVYPPLALLLFRLLAAVDLSPLLFKLFFTACDLGVLVVLVKLASLLKRPVAWLLLYAANPLVMLYFAGEGHLDVVQVFLLVLGLYLHLSGRPGAGFLAIGAAAMVKYLAAVAVPFLLTRDNCKRCLAAFVPAVFFLLYADAGAEVFRSLGAFGRSMHYNDSVMAVLRYFCGAPAAIWLGIGLLGACLTWIFLFDHDPLHSVDLAMAATLLFLPTLHPWYLVLVAPFLVFYPSAAWVYLLAAAAFTLPVLGVEFQTGAFQEIHWLKIVEYGPFYLLLIRGWARGGMLFRQRTYPPLSGTSVIVPTLQEAGSIGGCLDALQRCPQVSEILVEDGGSTDKTRLIARQRGATVHTGTAGRGLQIHRGITRAAGELIVIVHADCRVAPDLFERMHRALVADAGAAGGAVGMRFEEHHPSAAVIAFLNNLRLRLTGIAFGDQVQFFRRCALRAGGGYPEMMLMEDVELSFRLSSVGRLVFLPKGVRVSSRRWQGRGVAGNLWLVLRLFFRFLIERRLIPGPRHGGDYYAVYYTGLQQAEMRLRKPSMTRR
jgi:rSAM/selenodomain-associated transferase 2